MSHSQCHTSHEIHTPYSSMTQDTTLVEGSTSLPRSRQSKAVSSYCLPHMTVDTARQLVHANMDMYMYAKSSPLHTGRQPYTSLATRIHRAVIKRKCTALSFEKSRLCEFSDVPLLRGELVYQGWPLLLLLLLRVLIFLLQAQSFAGAA